MTPLEAPCCGQQLEPHAGLPDSAPYLCAHCHRGFWVGELSPSARALYRPLFHDWGVSLAAAALREAVDREREEAHARGTSALHEHLPLLARGHLAQLQRLPLRADMAAAVNNALNSTHTGG